MEPISLGMQLANRITSDPGFNEQNVEDPRTRIAIWISLEQCKKAGWFTLQEALKLAKAVCIHPRSISINFSIQHAPNVFRIQTATREICKLREMAAILRRRDYSSHYWAWLHESSIKKYQNVQWVPIHMIRDNVPIFEDLQMRGPSSMITAWNRSTTNNGADWESLAGSDSEGSF